MTHTSSAPLNPRTTDRLGRKLSAATPMNERIGRAVTALLSLTDSGEFGLTASPIKVEILPSYAEVTLYGAKADGSDVQIVMRLSDGAVTGTRRVTAFRRDWDTDGYTDWTGCDEAEAAFAAVAA